MDSLLPSQHPPLTTPRSRNRIQSSRTEAADSFSNLSRFTPSLFIRFGESPRTSLLARSLRKRAAIKAHTAAHMPPLPPPLRRKARPHSLTQSPSALSPFLSQRSTLAVGTGELG